MPLVYGGGQKPCLPAPSQAPCLGKWGGVPFLDVSLHGSLVRCKERVGGELEAEAARGAGPDDMRSRSTRKVSLVTSKVLPGLTSCVH